MSNRNILEKALVALLNEEHDSAEELFHKFIVERARQIHESNRQGEDFELEENWDDELKETFFSEDDLAGLEDEDDAGEELGDELGADGSQDGDFGGQEDGAADFGGQDEDGAQGDELGMGDEMGGDLDDAGAEGTAEERLDSIEDELEKLTAEFEAMMDAFGEDGDISDEDDLGGDQQTDDLGGDDFGASGEQGDDGAQSGDDMGLGDDFGAGGGEQDEDGQEDDQFDDITESIIDELEKVSVDLTDGKEIGAGSSFTQNKSAGLPQKNKDARQGGEPVQIKSSKHAGFARETAPSVADMKARRNTKKDAEAGRSPVSKEGDASAEINKLKSDGNNKSPLQGQ